MKISYTHYKNFGSYAPKCPADRDGFIAYHKSLQYQDASDAQLIAWSDSNSQLVRNAVEIENSNRKVLAFAALSF